ncbi:MAG: Txe/YoeB family addiction module toxin [Synergistaceae bacterium]|nr:Txe/YoeB family addiction module toxin [Synergistaceae bacterium]
MRKIIWTLDAWNEYIKWQETDRKILSKINQIIKDILRNGNDGIGQPEALKYELRGLWSRRINKEHRLVYQLTDDSLDIVSCAMHYQDLKD